MERKKRTGPKKFAENVKNNQTVSDRPWLTFTTGKRLSLRKDKRKFCFLLHFSLYDIVWNVAAHSVRKWHCLDISNITILFLWEQQFFILSFLAFDSRTLAQPSEEDKVVESTESKDQQNHPDWSVVHLRHPVPLWC